MGCKGKMPLRYYASIHLTCLTSQFTSTDFGKEIPERSPIQDYRRPNSFPTEWQTQGSDCAMAFGDASTERHLGLLNLQALGGRDVS
jgi:hypothetical protein